MSWEKIKSRSHFEMCFSCGNGISGITNIKCNLFSTGESYSNLIKQVAEHKMCFLWEKRSKIGRNKQVLTLFFLKKKRLSITVQKKS